MAMYLNIRRINEDIIAIDFPKPVEVVSTLKTVSINNSEPTIIRHAIFKHVESNFHVDNIVEYYLKILKELDVESGIVFLTAVPMDKLLHVEGYLSEIVMTIGLEPPVCIRYNQLYEPLRMGTINILIYVDLPLSKEAMVDLLKTAIEAKVVASSDLLLRCKSRAVGTVTDAIAVARPYGLDGGVLFSGMATSIGNSVANIVYNSIISVGIRNGIEWLLKNCIGYSMEEFLELFRNIYASTPIPNISLEKAIEKARKILHRILKDPNVWSFIIAARELDLHGSSGTVPGLTTDEYSSDTIKIVADELLGISLALYVGGANAMFAMYWIENMKKIGKLKYNGAGLYIDDIISAILGSLYTLLINEIDRGSSNE
ncbi:MAG: phosphatidylglycerophosphatase A [Ignisphaera sp.]